MKQVPSFSIAGFSAGNRRRHLTPSPEVIKSLGGMIIAAVFLLNACGQNEQQLRAGVVRAWQYTLMPDSSRTSLRETVTAVGPAAPVNFH